MLGGYGKARCTVTEFTDRESEFLKTASEIITGIQKSSAKQDKPLSRGQTFVTHTESSPKKMSSKKCKECSGQHGLWGCQRFKNVAVYSRWEVAKKHKLCFRCLSDGNSGESCLRGRMCNLNGCRSFHHRLLHEDPAAERNDGSPEPRLGQEEVMTRDHPTEEEAVQKTLTTTTS